MVIKAGPPVDEKNDEREKEWLIDLIESMKEETNLTPTYIDPDSSCLVPYSNETSMNDAAFLLSDVVYESFKRAVAHSLFNTTTNTSGLVLLEDPQYFFFGKYKFHWTVFLYGVKKAGIRDRSPWDSRGKLVPFEQIRRDLAKFGIYLLLRYDINHVPCACVFLKGTQRFNNLLKMSAEKKLAWIDNEYDKIDHPYQIVPH